MLKNILKFTVRILAITATAAHAEVTPNQDDGSVYALVGQQTGAGQLLSGKAFTAVEIGARARGAEEPGRFKYMYEIFVSSSNSRTGESQVSFSHGVAASVFSVGYAPGLCYLTPYLNICPHGVMSAVNISEPSNSFGFLSIGYGLELEKVVGSWQILAKATKSEFSQKTNDKREWGGFRTISVGAGYILK